MNKKSISCLLWTFARGELCQFRKAKCTLGNQAVSHQQLFCLVTALQLDTASTTNTLAVEDLAGMCPAVFGITKLIKPSSAILHTYGGNVIKPVGQIELMCETRGKLHPLQFQLLSKDDMGSQPPVLSGSDCVKLGLIEIKGSTSPLRQGDAQDCARKPEVCHFNESSIEHGAQAQSSTAVEGTMPVSLNDKPREEFKPTDLPSNTYPVNHVREDASKVHSTAASESKDKPAIGLGLGMNSSHMPVPRGKLTKDVVMNTFKDVHTGLGTLGPPLHITTNPNVTPIQAHPHRCPVAKEAQAAEAIRDLEKQGILKKVTEPTAWISNSVYREKNPMVVPASASTPARPSIKPLRFPVIPYLQLMSCCQS